MVKGLAFRALPGISSIYRCWPAAEDGDNLLHSDPSLNTRRAACSVLPPKVEDNHGPRRQFARIFVQFVLFGGRSAGVGRFRPAMEICGTGSGWAWLVAGPVCGGRSPGPFRPDSSIKMESGAVGPASDRIVVRAGARTCVHLGDQRRAASPCTSGSIPQGEPPRLLECRGHALGLPGTAAFLAAAGCEITGHAAVKIVHDADCISQRRQCP